MENAQFLKQVQLAQSVASCAKATSSTKKSSKPSGHLSGFLFDTCQPKNIEPYPKINSLQGVCKKLTWWSEKLHLQPISTNQQQI